MKESDVVKLKEAFKGIPAGTMGTIVLEYDGSFFEVEFYDSNGKTIDVITTPVSILEIEIIIQQKIDDDAGNSPHKHCRRVGQYPRTVQRIPAGDADNRRNPAEHKKTGELPGEKNPEHHLHRPALKLGLAVPLNGVFQHDPALVIDGVQHNPGLQ